jgi:hypothetical protein
MKYTVEITEYLQRLVTVDAPSERDAVSMVRQDYRSSKIVLGAEDFNVVEFTIPNDE